jgi:hypothetical protein
MLRADFSSAEETGSLKLEVGSSEIDLFATLKSLNPRVCQQFFDEKPRSQIRYHDSPNPIVAKLFDLLAKTFCSA